MGNCLSGGDTAARRQQAWRSTGVVALRDDAKARTLPAAVLELPSGAVRVLDASGSALQALPDDVPFPGLQRLVLQRCVHLAALPAQLGQSCAALKVLDVSGCRRLQELPAELPPKLETLALGGSAVAALPASIGRLAGLKQLMCAGARLTALPPSLGGCAALEELDVSGNQLTLLPEELASLRRLAVLRLDGNAGLRLPGDTRLLEGCAALHTLSVRGCPLVTAAVLEALPGYEGYERRRRAKYDKAIAGGASTTVDEGVDRATK